MKDIHKILPQLVCPLCNSKLSHNTEKKVLFCMKEHKWNIIKGIPRFINSNENYASAFGSQWNRYKKTQLDSFTNTNISKDMLVNIFGPIYQNLNNKK